MDADTVREVEFGRKLRGYDMGEVDAFLEKVEEMLRRRERECEKLEHRLEEMSGARDAQGEKLDALNRSLENLRQENAKLTRDLQAAQEAAAQRDGEIQQLQAELAQAKRSLALARTETLDAEQRCIALTAAAQEAASKDATPKKIAVRENPEPRANRKMDFAKSLRGAGEAAKKMTESLKNLAKK